MILTITWTQIVVLITAYYLIKLIFFFFGKCFVGCRYPFDSAAIERENHLYTLGYKKGADMVFKGVYEILENARSPKADSSPTCHKDDHHSVEV